MPMVSGIADANPSHCHTVLLCGQPIAALMIDGRERLCLAQISNTLLKNFSYNEIHNRRVALGITCVQCTPVQLEILRRAGAMPVSSRRCGMISKREAERLCKSFLCDNGPPKLPDNFVFEVFHACAWGCRGNFMPSRYNSSRAKCIKCVYCNLFFSPNKFIFHSHRTPTSKYQQPDAANFNSWRRHIKLLDDANGEPSDDLLHAWEDVKAMFNGGSRKRSMYHATHTTPSPRASHNPNIGLTPPAAKTSRLDLDPVINNLSLGHGIGYPLMPIPNRSSFTTGGNDSLTNDKQDNQTMFGSGGSFFGRQFATQAIRPRTFTDLFWPNGRVPYPFTTGFWPKGRDGNFTMVSSTAAAAAAAAAIDKKFSTTCCPLTTENSTRFLGSLKMSTQGNVIDNEREEIREGIKTRSIPPMQSYYQEQTDMVSKNKYMSAFRRVKKAASSSERDLGFLESNNEEERLSSPLETPLDRETSPVNVGIRLYDGCGLESPENADEECIIKQGAKDADYNGEEKRNEDDSSDETHPNEKQDTGNVDVLGADDEERAATEEAESKRFSESPSSQKEDIFRSCSPGVVAGSETENTTEGEAILHKQTLTSNDELKRELLKEAEERERITRECRMLKDSFEGFMKREVQYRQLKDQLCLELDHERKARLNTQHKLKEAQETLQEFSYKMLLTRHCVEGTRSTAYPRTGENHE
ncbi:uncharacterized protein [Amphiura filiformis]|uniref:uncharacterized protein isoform X1 n=1 Tax=Amphiura filiformis TaxID=82378 RepID=UPI003B2106A3